MTAATTARPVRLSSDAAMIYRAITGGTPARSRDLRHGLPRRISRQAFARAWTELVRLGLVKPTRGGDSRCPAEQ